MLATRLFEFDAAHRVLHHDSCCRFIHGHRYKAEIIVSSGKLNSLGMVFDFGEIKKRIGQWILENLDHNILLHCDDPLVKVYNAVKDDDMLLKPASHDPHENLTFIETLFAGKQPFVMSGNPTAENMAKCLFDIATNLLSEVKVEKVRIWETPNCWAEYPGSFR